MIELSKRKLLAQSVSKDIFLLKEISAFRVSEWMILVIFLRYKSLQKSTLEGSETWFQTVSAWQRLACLKLALLHSTGIPLQSAMDSPLARYPLVSRTIGEGDPLLAQVPPKGFYDDIWQQHQGSSLFAVDEEWSRWTGGHEAFGRVNRRWWPWLGAARINKRASN